MYRQRTTQNLRVFVFALLVLVAPSIVVRASLAQEKVLTHWWWGGSVDEITLQRAKADFESQHPNIRVDLVRASLDEALVYMAAGKIDTMKIDSQWFPGLYGKNVFLPLNEFVEKDPEKERLLSDFWPSSYRWAESNGVLYGFPFMWMQVEALFFNREMFGRAGLALPNGGWGWNEVLGAARKLTIPERQQYGITFDFNWQRLAKFALMNGGGFTDHQERPTAAALDAAPTLESAEFWVSLVTHYRVAGGKFPEGNVGMDMTWWGRKGTWNAPEHPLPFDFDMASPPPGPSAGGNVRYPAATHVTAIASSTKHPELAYAWIKHLAAPPLVQLGAERGGGIPTRRSVATSSAWLDADDKNDRAVFIPLQAATPVYPMTPALDGIGALLAAPVREAFQGTRSIGAILRGLNKQVDTLIREVAPRR